MATSTFHRHFRDVTTLSPLQYQKRLRLYEAQRLMLVENEDAALAALAVGYESSNAVQQGIQASVWRAPSQACEPDSVARRPTGKMNSIPPAP